MAVHLIRTEKNKMKLCDDENYIYEKNGNNQSKTKTYWRCECFYSGCRARVHTPFHESDDDKSRIIHRVGSHNHPANSAKVEARIAVSVLKNRIKTSESLSSRDAISTTVQTLGEEAKFQLQSIPTLSRSVRKWKHSNMRIPAHPTSRCGFQIPDSFKNLCDGSLFLAYDSGVEDPQRIIIFASQTGLSDLEISEHWACDGTFKSCPTLWFQLITIHAKVGRYFVPRLFSLLPDKRQVTYCRLFSAVRELCPKSLPLSCSMDFEKGMHNAFISAFPCSKIAGCLFHFGQSIWRKICELGKRVQYNNDSRFAMRVKCFIALAFLPIDDVVTNFEDLSDNDDIPSEFITYFERTYIGIVRGRGSRRRREEPIFPVEIWNVHNRTLNGLPRTNNGAEAYHNALRSSITSVHPNFWNLCKSLAKEEALMQTKIAHIKRGDTITKSKKYEANDERLKRAVQEYLAGNRLNFLESIAHGLD